MTDAGQTTQLITAKSIAEALGNSYKGMGFYRSRCPGHNSETPALQIRTGRGRLMVYCHAGCTRDKIIEAAIRENALPADWAAQLARGTRDRRGAVVMEYDWVWADGQYRATHQRREQAGPTQPKFTWCRYPTADRGRTVGNMGGGAMPLYNLPELTVDEGIVWFCEGEKDCETLSDKGLLATCAYGTGFADARMCEVLRGRDVVLLPDHDPAGRTGAAKTADVLVRVGVGRCRILVLPNGGTKGFDATDWFEGGGDADALSGLLSDPEVVVWEVRETKDIPWVDWRNGLQVNGEGVVLQNEFNTSWIMLHHPALRGCVVLDTFKGEHLVVRGFPWDDGRAELPRALQEVGDATGYRAWLSAERLLRSKRPWCLAAIEEAADGNRVDVLADWLDGLSWGGAEGSLIDTWLARACPLAESQSAEFVSRAGRYFAIGTVARGLAKQGRDPVKMDSILVLEGAQGLNKSKCVRILGIRQDWVVESPNLRGDAKQLGETIRGVWVAEADEILMQNKLDTDHMKSQLSRVADTYRPAYARLSQTFPRRSVFVGTLNDRSTGWAKDPTGNRRYWPVKLAGPVDVAWLEANIKAIYAEAVALYRGGERWWFEGAEADLQAAEMDERMDLRPVAEVIQRYIEVDPWSGKAREECLDRVWFDTFMADCRMEVEGAYGGRVPAMVLEHFQQAMEHWGWRKAKSGQKVGQRGRESGSPRRRGAWLSPKYAANAKCEMAAGLRRGSGSPADPGSAGGRAGQRQTPGTWGKYVSLTPADPADPSFFKKDEIVNRGGIEACMQGIRTEGESAKSGLAGPAGPAGSEIPAVEPVESDRKQKSIARGRAGQKWSAEE